MQRTSSVAIQFGSAETQIATPGESPAYIEPTVAAIDARGRVLVGHEAIGQRRKHAVWPIREDVVHDREYARRVANTLLRRAAPGGLRFRRRVVLAVPGSASPVEREAFDDVFFEYDLRKIALPVAAANGAGVPFGGATSVMLIHFGAGRTEVAVLERGGLIWCEPARLATGACMERAVKKTVCDAYRVNVADQNVAALLQSGLPATAEDASGRFLPSQWDRRVQRAGMEISRATVEEALSPALEDVADLVREAASDEIMNGAVVLTGPYAAVPNLAAAMKRRLGALQFVVAPDPGDCVMRGLRLALQEPKRARAKTKGKPMQAIQPLSESVSSAA